MLTPSLTRGAGRRRTARRSPSRGRARPAVGSNSIGSVRVLKPPMAGGVGHGRLDRRGVVVVADAAQLGHFLVAEDRVLDLDLAARVGPRIEQVAFRADGRGHRRDQLLADRVERRVGDLREQLLEVVEQQPRLGRQHRQRRCPCPSSRSLPRRPAPSARAAGAGPPRCSRRRAAGAARSCDRAPAGAARPADRGCRSGARPASAGRAAPRRARS